MRRVRTVLLGTLIGLAISVLPALPAAATTGLVATGVAVTGEPWSAPAYPVDCDRADSYVSCTAQDADGIKPMQCFIDVKSITGDYVTVCTTYEGHHDALEESGRAANPAYGCSFGDVVCVAFENAGRGMAQAATGAFYLFADNTRFNTGTVLWDSATLEWSFWSWAVLGILFIAMVWSITAAIVSQQRDELVGAIVRSFIAFPATALTLWLSGLVVNAVDDLTYYILGRGSNGELLNTLLSVMWAGGEANYFFAFLMHGLIMVAIFLLTFVFLFRNLALAALVLVGPVAWMVFPLKGVGPQWVVRYLSALVVLLLTGPLTLGLLALVLGGLARVDTIWDPQAWPMLLGLVLIAFAPFAVFGLFSFVGAVAADGLGSRMGGSAGRVASNATRSVTRGIPTRMGASPAGRGATPGRSTTSPPAGGSTRPSSSSGPSSPAAGPTTPARTGTGAAGKPTPTGPPSSTGTAGSRQPAASPSSTPPGPPTRRKP